MVSQNGPGKPMLPMSNGRLRAPAVHDSAVDADGKVGHSVSAMHSIEGDNEQTLLQKRFARISNRAVSLSIAA